MEALQLQYDGYNSYTYADYASWQTEKRYELIDGKAYLMAAPSEAHQTITVELLKQIAIFLTGKTCKVFVAPFDVCLNAKGDNDNTVVQPDILVVCDRSKLDGKRCNGAPDMVIEVLSPSSSKKDRYLKFLKYQNAGVREYWVVDPEFKIVQVGTLEKGSYSMAIYEENDTVSVNVLEGCDINLKDVFAEIVTENDEAAV